MSSNLEKTTYAGRWCFGDQHWDIDRIGYCYAMEIHVYKRPPLIHRWLMAVLLGILWREADRV